MSDIKTEPDVSVCCGCLSTDRTLSLTNEDLYWSFIKEEHQDKLLISPYLCWECSATARRLRRFQTQVQKAYSVLWDCLVHSLDFDRTDPKYEKLSTLNVHHSRKFDATFAQVIPDAEITNYQAEIPLTNVDSKNEHKDCKEMKNEPSSDLSDDDDNLKKDNNDTSVSPGTNGQNAFRHPEQKNLVTIEIETIREKYKPQIEHNSNPSKPRQTENLLKKLKKANIVVKRTCVPNKVSLYKTPSITAIEMELKKIINAQKNVQIDKEEWLQTNKIVHIKFDNINFEEETIELNVSESKFNKPKKLSHKIKVNKNTKKVVNTKNINEYSDEDDFVDTAFNDDYGSDYVQDKNAKAPVKSKRKRSSKKRKTKKCKKVDKDVLLLNNCTVSVEPLSFPKPSSVTKLESILKKVIQDTRIPESQKRSINYGSKIDNNAGKDENKQDKDEDDFVDTEFNDDYGSDYVQDKNAKAPVKSKRKRSSKKRKTKKCKKVDKDDLLLNNCTVSVEPLSFPKPSSVTKLESILKKVIQDTRIPESQKRSINYGSKIDNNAGKDENKQDKDLPKVKKARTTSETDPDFCPTGDEEVDEEAEEEKKLNVPKMSFKFKVKKYKKAITRYSTLEDVSRYFTEVEMSEQEVNTILKKEDAVVYEKKPFSCFICGMSYEMAKHMYRHATRVHRIPPKEMLAKKIRPGALKIPEVPTKPCLWKCHICTRYLRKGHALAHFNEHHRNHLLCNVESCHWCPKIYWTKEEFRDHYERMHRNYICDICGKQRPNMSGMEWHMNAAHFRIPTLQCPHCPDKYYLNQRQVKHHMNLAHSQPEPVELRYCVECDVTFQSSRRYKLHIHNKHKPKQDWPCPECPAILKSKLGLDGHVDLIHRGFSRFQCDKCGKYLSKKMHLDQHLLLHLDVKPKAPYVLPCPMCGRMFQTNKILKNHILTHTGERPHKCELCPAAYTQKHCLKTHLAKAHDIHIVPKLTRPPATVQSVPHAPVAVRNVPGASVTVQNVPGTTVTVRNVPVTSVNVQNVPQVPNNVKNVPETSATVQSVPQAPAAIPGVFNYFKVFK